MTDEYKLWLAHKAITQDSHLSIARKTRESTAMNLDEFLEHDGPVIDLDEYLPPVPKGPREREIAITMFWRHEKCNKCKHNYSATAYGNDTFLKYIIEAPIIRFGKHYGWRFVSVGYKPAPDYSCFDHLPREVEHLHVKIRHCPRCIQRPGVIFLEGPTQANNEGEDPCITQDTISNAG